MDIVYRKATLDDLPEINDLVKNAIIEMEKSNIHQWDDIYPTAEDFKIDINDNSAYIGILELL